MNDESYISKLREQLNQIKSEREKTENIKNEEEEEERKKKEKDELLNDIINKYANFEHNILNKINSKEENNNNNDNNNLYPKDQNDEDEQYKLALKQSEEEAKKQLEMEKEEEKQIQLAIEESKKYNHYNNEIKDNYNNEIKEEEFDEEYGICPITQEYMENPVLSPSGNYYEKSAIIDWINKNHNDPLTREYLTDDMLIEDNEYKKKILEYRKKFNK